MRRAFAAVFTVSAALLVLGCPKKKDAGGDAAAEAAATASAEVVDAAPAQEAANQGEVKTYPDQKAIDHAPLTVMWTVANVRTAAGSGELVATLKKGTSVQKIAEKEPYFLVLFDDPSDASRKVEGWASHLVFTPEPPHDAGKIHPVCAAKQVIILLEGGNEECVTPCTSDNDCGTGKACNGDGVLSNNWQPGNPVQFCRIGGRGATTDAGVATADAAPPSKAVKIPPDNKGACPDSYAVVKSGTQAWCRLKCGKFADCGIPAGQCTAGVCVPAGDHL
jgi:hypothetical protein